MTFEQVGRIAREGNHGGLVLFDDKMKMMEEYDDRVPWGSKESYRLSERYKIYETKLQKDTRDLSEKYKLPYDPKNEKKFMFKDDILTDGKDFVAEGMERAKRHNRVVEDNERLRKVEEAQRKAETQIREKKKIQMLGMFPCEIVYTSGFLCSSPAEYERITNPKLTPLEQDGVLRVNPLRCNAFMCSGCTAQFKTPADILSAYPDSQEYLVVLPITLDNGNTLRVQLFTGGKYLSCPR
ncbi:hypothetical protein [uncultured Thiodictyon sp.]|uniref:hypothetical protein n=1 Tax=uncultured Thiodictyon sp. TaxID=1846217 RepID=UPI0025FC1790|nr:hypothetical protein [uncultured Thiodictyon sp.]